MGYDTAFTGTLKFVGEITVSQLKKLNELCDSDFREAETDFVPPEGEDLAYIDLRVTQEMDGLQWNDAEKTYYMVTAVNYILHEMRKQWPNFDLEGELLAQGDEIGDIWKVKMSDHIAVREELKAVGIIECPECGHKFVPKT